MIELYHSQEGGDNRGYDWIINVRQSKNARKREVELFGEGRVSNVTKATIYPNIRKLGPADFPEIYYIGDLIKDKTFHNLAERRLKRFLEILHEDEQKVLPYATAAYLGDTLFSMSLIIDTYLLRRKELNYQQETDQKDTVLQEALKILFIQGIEDYRGEKDIVLPELDIPLIARETAYYMTDQYLWDYKAQKKPPFPGEIGPIKPGKEWSERGWDLAKEVYSHIPTRNPEEWGKLKMHSFDLGPLNAPIPLQQLMKRIYIATSAMVQPRDSESTVGNSAKVTDQDKAMTNTGGIDLTSDKALQVKNDGNGEIQFHLDSAQLAQLQNAPGFTPVIISIQPMTDIKLFLGLTDNQSSQHIAFVST
ncbi:MAG: hypothetical protein HQL15_08915 [Candidatus Omnitrophica bacterium]|nr:hypothetical protein [Candidatus Omnitrophota bacterium]